jgi:hypothetical protein
MAKPREAWNIRPSMKRVTVSASLKAEVETKARDLIDNVLKPKHVLPPPAEAQFNYVTDIQAKWYRQYFYFVSIYACPGPNALFPTFESKFCTDGTPRRRQVCPLFHALYGKGMGWHFRCSFGGRVHESHRE